MNRMLQRGLLIMTLATSCAAVAGAPPVRQAGEATFAGVPRSVVAGIEQNPPKVIDYKPAQYTFVAKPGSMLTSTVSRDFLNRIVTPFANPVVKSTSPIKVQTMGSTVFVAVDPAQEDPVVLYVMDKGDSLDSIALMLQPKDVGPVEIDLQQSNLPGSAGQLVHFNDAAAARWEQSAPYTQTLTDLMRDIAQRKVPPGYAFRYVNAHDHMPACQQYGLSVLPRQVLEGHDMVAYVGVLTNVTNQPIEFQEQTCAVKGVLAVASWPGPLLQAHQSSEVYIIVKRSELPMMDDEVRPSALVGVTP